MVNQIELHIGYMQEEVIDYNRDNRIVTEGYSPLGTGALLDNEILLKMAEKYETTVSVICLSFLREKDIVILPKTISPERMRENLECIALKKEDTELLLKLPYIGGHAHNPDEVEF